MTVAAHPSGTAQPASGWGYYCGCGEYVSPSHAGHTCQTFPATFASPSPVTFVATLPPSAHELRVAAVLERIATALEQIARPSK